MKLQDFDTLAQAQDHITLQPSYISANTMNSLLAKHGLYIPMQRISTTDGHPAQNEMAAFFDSRSTDYNFIIGDTTGDNQISQLDALISAKELISVTIAGNTIDVAAKLTEIRSTLIFLCNTPYQPFKNTTKHSFDLAKGTITRKAVTQKYGILTIEITEDCELHSPQVYQYIAHANYYTRVAGFNNVGLAGVYQINVPQYSNLFIDDAYGKVAQLDYTEMFDTGSTTNINGE